MLDISEITSLFANLASNLQPRNPNSLIGGDDGNDEDINRTISTLNQALNLGEAQPRVSILDTALSLMCFTAPQVFELVQEHAVRTILAVLESSIECKVLIVGEKEILRAGGSFSSQDCLELMEMCVDILEKLEGHRGVSGEFTPSIVQCALRVGVLSLDLHIILESSTICGAHSFERLENSVQKLLVHVPKEVTFISRELPARLLFWHLDPAILQQDISQILQESSKRHFLCLRKAIHERAEWRSILICLALSPSMFIEARAMLHNWFLSTGLASVLELQTEIVQLVLDILSRPMWWGLSMEIGSKLPFSHAYFPFQQNLIRILVGPMSWANFQQLVNKISRMASHPRHSHSESSEQNGVKIELVDHYSSWATTMNFPYWFSFATVLLFHSPKIESTFQLEHYGDSYQSNALSKEEVPHSAAAARLIAWIAHPAADSSQYLFADYLAKISGSWSTKLFGPEKFGQASKGHKAKRELKSISFGSTEKIFDSHRIWLWLNEFQDTCFKYFRRVSGIASSSAGAFLGEGNQTCRLLRRIPLGILIGFLSSLDDIACELLLHYATTGTIFQCKERQLSRPKHGGRNCEWQQLLCRWGDTCSIEDAIAGARVVFDLTDAIDEMSFTLFENEERGIEFLCNVKLQVRAFLLKCVNRLLQADIDKGRRLIMFGDLCHRLVLWVDQGQEGLQDYKDFDDIIIKLRCVL